MSKKNKQARRPPVLAEGGGAVVQDGITALGLKIIGVGVAVIVLGFIVLSRADAMGSNWAANLSPFLILGGYVIVGLGIFAPEKLPAFAQTPSAPPPSSSL
jgi:hypothetical protein